MKNLSFYFATVFSVALILVSCSGGNNAEKMREDSIRKADSIRMADSIAAAEAALQAAEQARIDSLKQDSINQAEAFTNAVEGLKKLPAENKISSYLTKLGFTGSMKEEQDGQIIKFNYSLTKGEKSCKFSYTIDSTEAYLTTEKTTIEGDPELLENYYNSHKKNAGNGPDWFYEVKKQGNTVIVETGGA